MGEIELRIFNVFIEAVDFCNMVGEDGDASYAEERIQGMKEMAEAFGYVLSAHHKNDLIGAEYDSVSIAKSGNILAELSL